MLRWKFMAKEEFLKTKESDAVLVAIDNYKKTVLE